MHPERQQHGKKSRVIILATGGTIAGTAESGIQAGYASGQVTIEAMNEAGMRDSVSVMIGGAPVTADYISSVHLLGREFKSEGQIDRYPAMGMIPTSRWQRGDIYRDEYRITPVDPKARKFLEEEMEKFFFGEGATVPDEFVNPDP